MKIWIVIQATSPAPVVVAHCAFHVSTSRYFFEWRLALWTSIGLSRAGPQLVPFYLHLLLPCASPFMPRLITIVAKNPSAFITSQLHVFKQRPLICNDSRASLVWAVSNCSMTLSYLFRQLHSLVFSKALRPENFTEQSLWKTLIASMIGTFNLLNLIVVEKRQEVLTQAFLHHFVSAR